MQKVIVCNTPKGQYQIPLLAIAKIRAEYYSNVDGFEIGSEAWQKEIDYVMGDDFEGIDWLLGNSNWPDWKDIAKKFSNKVKVLEDDFWTSSDDFDIIEIED